MTLYLVATPIGNLEDITYRAVRILSESDLILCEDTRNSQVLFTRYGIRKPLFAYHKFNEKKREAFIIDELKQGKKISLVSDGGTPLICDPGLSIVETCIRKGYPVIPIPGPCAPITALCGSGWGNLPFQFIGFLPKTEERLKKAFLSVLCYEGISIAFEAPGRIRKTLALCNHLEPNCEVVIARELSKIHESFYRGSLSALCLADIPEKGECVFLFKPGNQSVSLFRSFSPEELVTYFQNVYSLTKTQAVALAARLRGISKKEMYAKTHH